MVDGGLDGFERFGSILIRAGDNPQLWSELRNHLSSGSFRGSPNSTVALCMRCHQNGVQHVLAKLVLWCHAHPIFVRFCCLLYEMHALAFTRVGWSPRKGAGGRTPLHQACYSDRPEMVKRLLRAGANSRAMTTARLTPLMTAARQGKPMLRCLLLSL